MNVTGLPTPPPEPFIDREALAELMGCSTDTVDRLRKAGMPSVLWGRRTRRFQASIAIAWALAHQGEKIAA